MPEYSTPKVTPTETTKIPGMNGNSSGYMDAKDLLDIIRATFGQANGVATLGSDGKLTSGQLPDLADDVIVVASYATLPNPGIAGKIYITQSNPTNAMYRWDDSLATPDYVELSVDLSSYATKAELAAEESARETEDTNLKNALQATNARVENLEQEHGSYQEVTAKSPYTIPSGKAKNWSVNVLRGVTRAKNNWNNGPSATFSVNGVTFTNNGDGSVTLSGTASSVISQQIWTNYIPFMANHFYFIGGLRAVSGIQYGVRGFAVNNASNFVWSYTGDWTNCLAITIQSGTNCNGITLKPTVTDLNTYFGTNDLSFLGATDSAKLATILTDYPSLLEYSSYDEGSLVDTEYEGAKGVGNNRMSLNGFEAVTSANITFTPTFNSDGELEYITATGTSNASGNFDILRYDDFHLPVGTYFLGFGANSLFNDILVYVNGVWATLNRNGGTITVTDPSQAIWVRGRFASGVAFGGAKLYPKVNIGSTELPFSPYTTDTLSLPTPITLRSAGSVAEELDLESGVKTNPLATKDLSTLTWTYNTSLNGWWLSSAISDAKIVGSDGVPNWTCDKFNVMSGGSAITGNYPNAIGQNGSGQIICYNGSSSIAPSGTLYYELATPTTEQLDPIQNPYLPTESGGTISSILTDAVDDSITLGYINL